jgi:hypothetical protein
MKLANFRSAADLQQFCVDEPVAQADIVQIVYDGSRWYLFYY